MRRVENYQSHVYHGMIGASIPMQTLFKRIEKYAPTDAPVVITGETGTGKEMVARALHRLSSRRNNNFVAINCTAIHEDLLESELFGHERGAFTGAVKSHRGRFERADNGTLFLDEIGDMQTATQVKLLRVLEERKFERIGGETLISVDVRIVAATNVSLERSVGAGKFRSDLYHRLAVLRLHVPPLRERGEDIALLVDYFLHVLNRRYGKDIRRLTPDAVRLLEDYLWPGNIRELRNVLERVYVETESNIIGRNAFKEWEIERDYLAAGAWDMHNLEYRNLSRDPIVPPAAQGTYWSKNPSRGELASRVPRALLPDQAGDSRQNHPSHQSPSSGFTGFSDGVIEGEFQVVSEDTQREITPELLKEAYRANRGNISAAARSLGIHKATFYRYMKRFKLDRNSL